MSERYFVAGSLPPGSLVIEGAEAHHLAAVCRLNVADRLTLFNGDGNDYPAIISGIERRRVIVEVGEAVKINRELPHRVEIAAPLPKGDRAQFMIEKLTELGVASFVPLLTRRGVVKPHENKQEKLQRYVIEASKQCGRNVLMAIQTPQRWEDYCRRDNLPQGRYVAHPGGTHVRTTSLKQADVTFAIGPEGGFSDEEIDLARSSGWTLLDLGPRILRVETAALAAAAWAGTNVQWESFT